jgi:hypothetical protein
MGSLMLKLGLVELSSKAIGTVLKSNAITFVAGGAVQGVSAAYLTRLAGLSLIEYFQQQEVATPDTKLNIDKLGQTLQNVFQQNQQIGFLSGFVKQTVNGFCQHLNLRLMSLNSCLVIKVGWVMPTLPRHQINFILEDSPTNLRLKQNGSVACLFMSNLD